jgi:signal peptidase I
MRINLNMLTRVSKWTAGLLSGLAVLSLVGYAGLYVAGYRPAAVYSGSMVPTLKVGSLAFERSVPASSVKVGDVITFTDPYVPGRLVTHRVIRVVKTDHGLAYRTKGDANPVRDPWTIALPGQVGKVSFSVPLAGYALVYARTKEIRTALILLASLALLGGVLRKIWTPKSKQLAGLEPSRVRSERS